MEFLIGKLTTPLTAYVGTRIFADVQPGDATWPVVIFQLLAAPDTLGAGATRVMTRAVYRIKAITKGAGMQLPVDIAAAIDSALHKADGVFSGFYVTAHRVNSFAYSEVSSGETFRHVGGEYRVDVHPQ